jgi:hypothetical protein
MSINWKQLIIGICGVGSAVSIALERFVQAGHQLPLGITAAVLSLIASIFGIVSAAEGTPLPPPPSS